MLALDRDATVEVVLSSDKSKSPETRPTWMVRFPTARTMLRIHALFDRVGAASDPQAQIGVLEEVLGLLLVGGRNLPGDFDVSKLADWLTVGELWELVIESLAATRLAEEDRKKSASPSPSAGESCAAAVAATDATASTHPGPASASDSTG